MIRRAAFRLSTAAVLLVALAASAYAATPATLVRDIRRQPGPNLSSFPSSMISLGSRALFWAWTPLLGSELYRTDGTAAGTSLVTDLCPGPCSSGGSGGIAVGGRAFFIANDGARGSELWTSDGTPGGTRQLLDLGPGPAEGFYFFLLAGGDRLLFETFGPPFVGRDFWSSDGTAAGTVWFAHLADGAEGGVVIAGDAAPGGPLPGGRRLYFRNFSPTEGLEELWQSDGTAAGTRRVLALPRDAGGSICAGDSADLPRVASGDFYFAAGTEATGCELWRVAGGVAAPLADLAAGDASSNPRSFVRQGEWTLFAADRADGISELWTTDGSLERTLPAARSGPPAGTSPKYLGSNSARAYFAAETPEEGRELWATDGAPGHFGILSDGVIGPGSSDPRLAGVARNRVFFWSSDPVRGTELNAASVVDIRGVARVRERSSEDAFAAVGERAIFGADLGLGVGVEPAVTNGYPGSTGLLRDLAQGDPSSNPRQLTRVEERLLFSTIGDDDAARVWRSDGTSAGTERVADFAPGQPQAGARPYFLASTATGVVFAEPDGSIRHAPARRGGIEILRPAGLFSGAGAGFRLGGKGLFFAPAGDAESPRIELWRTDGRPEGTRRLAEVGRFGSFGFGVVSAADPERRRAFFIPSHISSEIGLRPLGLWTTDGSAAGTRRLVSEPCGFCFGGVDEAIVGPGGSFVYSAEERDEDVSRLWASDGTSTEPVLLAESPGLVDGDPIRSLARLGELLLFAASDPEHGQELWVSDGTPAGTRLLADLRPGPAPSWPDGITVVGDRAFFSADDGLAGRELWATDGTEQGTYRVADIRRGTRPSVPQALTAIGNRLVFAADDGKHGLEVWASDGTAAGTRLASDVQTGRLPSSPGEFVALGSDLLFVAARASTGRELFRLPLSALGTP